MTAEASGSNSQNRSIPFEGIPLNNGTDNWNYSISAVLVSSGITTVVLLILTTLAGTGVLPNAIVFYVSSTGLTISAVVFLVFCKLRCCPPKELSESFDNLEKAKADLRQEESDLGETLKNSIQKMAELELQSKENEERQTRESKENEERRISESKANKERSRILEARRECRREFENNFHIMRGRIVLLLACAKKSDSPDQVERMAKLRSEIDPKIELCTESLEKWKAINPEDSKLQEFEQRLQDEKDKLNSISESNTALDEIHKAEREETQKQFEKESGEAAESREAEARRAKGSQEIGEQFYREVERNKLHGEIIDLTYNIRENISALKKLTLTGDPNGEEGKKYKDEINSKISLCYETYQKFSQLQDKKLSELDQKITEIEQDLQKVKSEAQEFI